MSVKTVGIIGGGASGICAAKYAVDSHITPIVFEKCGVAGGLWAPNTAAWEDMCAIHSRFTMSFSDFAWADSAPIIPSLADVSAYLNSYIDHFHLRQHFRFNTSVNMVTKLADKRWRIEWTTHEEESQETIVDYVVFASGLNSTRRIPHSETLANFVGLVLHSSQIKSTVNEELRNKRVLVVGNGLSGIEISSELVGFAASVVNVFNRPSLILPRLVVAKTMGQESKQRIHST